MKEVLTGPFLYRMAKSLILVFVIVLCYPVLAILNGRLFLVGPHLCLTGIICIFEVVNKYVDSYCLKSS